MVEGRIFGDQVGDDVSKGLLFLVVMMMIGVIIVVVMMVAVGILLIKAFVIVRMLIGGSGTKGGVRHGEREGV